MKTFKFRDPLSKKEANELLDKLIVVLYLELGTEKAKELFAKAKDLKTKK